MSLGFQLAFSVSGIGVRSVGGAYGGEVLFVTDSPCSEAARHDELFRNHFCFDEGLGEIFHKAVVDSIEVIGIFAFCNPQIINDVVPCSVFLYAIVVGR